ncbi:Alginate export [Oceanospirillum multiglobuliferum]|uniref:Alginate export domain-containing protein n=1 Tax=Oceanospirillum multiglobuliferum TaxID=64969 RepID=A0A1T4P354_9GAMM|nr:alginate export family protein [Oceanospirillum multiglobuliferum]OPX55117.1 hypothetical protein BTE48_10850 [Oceanospirillum multiglobuliferum]SJZ85889.1 Alginate export [Oceanospirillum multiglobuliferum]
MFKITIKPICAALFLASLPAVSQAVMLSEADNSSVAFNLEAAASAMSLGENYSGTPGSKKWQEFYLKGDLVATRQLNAEHSFYGNLGLITQGTLGDGDGAGFTDGTERKTQLENASIGWVYQGGLVDLSIGKQKFVLGDGFLIAGDSLNVGKGFDSFSNGSLNRGGAYYLAASKSFENSVVLKVDPEGPLRGDLFWLKSNNQIQQNTALAGANIEYVNEQLGTVGLSVLKVTDVDLGAGLALYDNRKGMDVVSLRGQGSAGVENLFLSFEYVKESGGDQTKKDANAWTAEAGWTFADSPWTPIINFRHAQFSGNKTGTSKDESFDPLFFGVTRGFGTWFQGEIAANYAGPFNSGNDVNRLDLTLSPQENIAIGVQYWQFGAKDSSDFKATEMDIYAFWGVNDNLSLIPLIGVYKPKGVNNLASQGNDNSNTYLQMMAVMTY